RALGRPARRVLVGDDHRRAPAGADRGGARATAFGLDTALKAVAVSRSRHGRIRRAGARPFEPRPLQPGAVRALQFRREPPARPALAVATAADRRRGPLVEPAGAASRTPSG